MYWNYRQRKKHTKKSSAQKLILLKMSDLFRFIFLGSQEVKEFYSKKQPIFWYKSNGYFSNIERVSGLMLFKFCSLKSSAAEFRQYRSPVGSGPSLNTWPRCEPHREHTTSVRVINRLSSFCVPMEEEEIGCQKLGQPVPDSYFVLEVNRGFPQAPQ